MEEQNSDPGSDRKRGIIKPVLLIGAVASAAILLTKKKKRVEQAVHRPLERVPSLPGTDPHHADQFYQLRMSRQQYENIRKYGGAMLVLQFYYPKASECGSPTLYVYNMKRLHQAIKGALPEVLSYGEVSKEPLRGRDQVLGDMQIKISELDQLIRKVTANNGGRFDNLIFNPVYREENPHIAYNVSVDGMGSASCDPSPPATAF